jgi:assimilatory nitrate reductase catalytic subunit
MDDGGSSIATTCAWCGVGCGIRAQVRHAGDRAVQLAPDDTHPANLGRWCSKGAALGETLPLAGRLLRPRVDGRPAFWGEALDRVAATFARIRAESGPQAIAFYVSGQLLTEDYYVANKFVKGLLGTANIDTNSRLCMASTVAAQKRAFGGDVVPNCYEDLELADLVVLVGSNTAWCHPVLYQRIAAARAARGTKVVVIDTRRTATAAIADLQLVVNPGTDGTLFNGLLVALAADGRLDNDFVEAHTQGFSAALSVARLDAPDACTVAKRTGLDAGDVATFYRWFAAHERTVTAWSQGVNQSAHGTDTVNTLLNVHLATGRIGRPGSGPLSLTGQPNAMGGREVGGLANQLAAHMALDDAKARRRLARFWGLPRVADSAGPKAVELFEAVHAGRVRALWVLGSNPAASLPDAARVDAALARCEFLVVSDCMADTDTLRHAQVALPAQAWGEKDGTVTNSERRISRQRALLPSPGEARPDWWAIAQVAHRLGHRRQFGWETPAAIFREHAQLTALDNDARHGRRGLDLSALAQLDDAGYAALAPVQWPVTGAAPQGTARLFSRGDFLHPDGLARFVPVGTRGVAHAVDADWPLALVTGRLRDQWHTMTRTGRVARLNGHSDEPFLAMHPRDAQEAALADGALAEACSRHARAVLRVRVDESLPRGRVFAPMHWSRADSAGGVVNALVNPACDPVSGQPEFKHTPVRVAPFAAASTVTLLLRRDAGADDMPLPSADYAVRVREQDVVRLELAFAAPGTDQPARLRALLQAVPGDGWLQLPQAGGVLLLRLSAGRVQTLAVAPAVAPAARAELQAMFRPDAAGDAWRSALAVAVDAGGNPAPGPLVCACLAVRRADVQGAIARGCRDAAALGRATGAGTRCGSCVPELSLMAAAAGSAALAPAGTDSG